MEESLNTSYSKRIAKKSQSSIHFALDHLKSGNKKLSIWGSLEKFNFKNLKIPTSAGDVLFDS